MPKNFARIFNTADSQVLFYSEPDTDNDGCEMIHQIVNIEDMQADIKLGGIPFKNVDKFWEKLDQHYAEEIVNSVKDLLKIS